MEREAISEVSFTCDNCGMENSIKGTELIIDLSTHGSENCCCGDYDNDLECGDTAHVYGKVLVRGRCECARMTILNSYCMECESYNCPCLGRGVRS